jgi:hypothetical protein
MPVHDWSRVDANLFHDFHQTWSINIRNALNAGLLPPGYSALVERHAGGLIPDVLAVQRRPRPNRPTQPGAGLLTPPPKTRHVVQAKNALAARGNRIVIRHRLGEVVCVIEIISPGNKSGRAALRAFVEKTVEVLCQGVHVLVIDLFPPTPRDPQGIHKAIWDEFEDEPFELPPDKPLTLAAYVAGDLTAGIATTAYVESIGVGDALPDMPAYLEHGVYVAAPLEATYQAAWATCPPDMRELVETGRLSDEEGSDMKP